MTIVGRSKGVTRHKQEDLSTFIGSLFYVHQCFLEKHEGEEWFDKRFYIFEPTAGDARDKQTSPIIILNGLLEKKRGFFSNILV